MLFLMACHDVSAQIRVMLNFNRVNLTMQTYKELKNQL